MAKCNQVRKERCATVFVLSMAEIDLHGAARNGDIAALGKDIAAGADVNSRDRLRRTPLHLASWAGQVRFSFLSRPRGAH